MSLRSPLLYVAKLDALAAAVAALPARDVDAASRFTAARRRAQSLGTRALLRAALGTHGATDDLEIVTRDDRPHIVQMPSLAVSLSHTGDLVACALSATPCGIDVQRKVDKPLLEIAQAFFTADEHAQLARLDGDARADLFYARWTLKEAWAKASGAGLLAALARVRVADAEGSDRWRAWSFAPAPDVAGAVVVQGAAPAPDVRVWRGAAFVAADFASEPVALAVRDA